MARIPRLYCEQPLAAGEEIALADNAASHAVRVMRLAAGDAVRLFNGDGRDYAAELTLAGRGAVRARILAAGEEEPLPALWLHLALGVSRGQRMDFALQKATELGVSVLSPLFTERSMVKLDERRAEQRLDHWRQVTIAACEQCGRRRLPRIDEPKPLAAWLAEGAKSGVLLDPLAPASLPELAAPRGEYWLLVGPEGGLSGEERRRATDAGLTPVRLGPRILRTETAPLAALSAIQALWGDFR